MSNLTRSLYPAPGRLYVKFRILTIKDGYKIISEKVGNVELTNVASMYKRGIINAKYDAIIQHIYDNKLNSKSNVHAEMIDFKVDYFTQYFKRKFKTNNKGEKYIYVYDRKTGKLFKRGKVKKWKQN